MSKFEKFYEAKDYILEFVKTELVGPVEEQEVLESSPLNTYVCGILWPQPLNAQQSKTEEEREYETCQLLADSSESGSNNDESEDAVPTELELDDTDDDVIAKSALRKPSTMGISVMLSADTASVNATFSFGTYIHSEEEREFGKEGKKRIFHLYTRTQHKIDLHFDLSSEKVIYVSDKVEKLKEYGISIHATKRMGKAGQERLITFSISNDKKAQSKDVVLNESALFQCEFTLQTPQGFFEPLDPGVSSIYDIEDEILAMQYRNVRNYAQGHGCATDAKVDNERCRFIKSEFIPVSEVRQMKPLEVGKEEQELFSLKYLSEGKREEIIQRLSAFVDKYQAWLKGQTQYGDKAEFSRFGRAVAECLQNISKCIERLRDGISCLKTNETTWRSFVLCNKSMYRQRVSMALINGDITSKEEFSAKMSEPRWYPFQLFYLLMIIPDFIREDSAYKDVVDLLWFPTGGGKTEAYLAVSAFIIFYERLSEKRAHYGTTIIMRYTLRLLTIQQFERASALICACEEIRRAERLGGNEISIGLWIGGGSTPNHLEDAKKALKVLVDGKKKLYDANPVQITKCPICGKELTATDYKIDNDGMKIVCENCQELPIYIVDDDIYEKMPTLVISTVDKFARIVWEERAGNLFGCNVEGTNKPKLIIQDELHLISGPLGTLTGLYEAAIDRLCQDGNGNKPKIIASTATVKNAAYQINGLYGRRHFQFPPSGLDNTDSFFAVQATKEEKPSRFYIGLSEQGGSMIDLMIRTYSVLAVADYYLAAHPDFDDGVVDQYYTIIGYFNAIKDLGTSSTVVKERMRANISSLLNGKFIEESKKLELDMFRKSIEDDDDDGDEAEVESQKAGNEKYKYRCRLHHGELTSRRTATEIKNILDDLRNRYQSGEINSQVYKYILSSNMFSVGVDINRLGLMVVYGQPKSNADYIQATSRVGRSNPGLVFTLYNAFRSRDRSYYERFHQYHSCFYRYVEPTSVTPFSQRSIEKGLHAVFIALVRHLVAGMAPNNAARKFSERDSTVREIFKYLLERVRAIQPDACSYAESYLKDVIKIWSNYTHRTVVYNNKLMGQNAAQYISLLTSAEDNIGDLPVLNSVRNVESGSNVFIDSKKFY